MATKSSRPINFSVFPCKQAGNRVFKISANRLGAEPRFVESALEIFGFVRSNGQEDVRVHARSHYAVNRRVSYSCRDTVEVKRRSHGSSTPCARA